MAYRQNKAIKVDERENSSFFKWIFKIVKNLLQFTATQAIKFKDVIHYANVTIECEFEEQEVNEHFI